MSNRRNLSSVHLGTPFAHFFIYKTDTYNFFLTPGGGGRGVLGVTYSHWLAAAVKFQFFSFNKRIRLIKGLGPAGMRTTGKCLFCRFFCLLCSGK